MIDVPSGRVVARVRWRGRRGRGGGVPQRAVVRARPGRRTAGAEVDVAYGGAIYASCRRGVGLRRRPRTCPELIAAGPRDQGRARRDSESARHPRDDRLSGIYGTILYDERRPAATSATWRSSPTARSTARRRVGDVGAHRAAARRRRLGVGSVRNDSIIGTTFLARVVGDGDEGVLTEVEGTAFRTGEHRFVLDPRDPLGTGFVLR